MNSSSLRYLPNIISMLRIGSVPVLAWFAFEEQRDAFAWLLVVAAATDVLDGWLARTFGWVSRIGALLDSIADVLLVLVTLYGVWKLHNNVIVDYQPVIWSVFSIWLIVHLTAIWRYGRLASFHTWFTRFGLALAGVFVVVLFFYAFIPWMYLFTAAICFLGGLENLAMIYLTPQWSPNLRGGLSAVLRKRRKEKRANE